VSLGPSERGELVGGRASILHRQLILGDLLSRPVAVFWRNLASI